MTVDVTRFRTFGDPGHMTSDTITKGVDGVHGGLAGLYMAREALPFSRWRQSLGRSRMPFTTRFIQFRFFEKMRMGIVTRGTGHALLFMDRL